MKIIKSGILNSPEKISKKVEEVEKTQPQRDTPSAYDSNNKAGKELLSVWMI